MIVQRQSKRRFGLIGFLVFGVLSVVALFLIKANALSAQKHVRALERDIAREAQAVRLMRAEIAYLERPERIAKLAREHLGLEKTTSKQVITLGDVARAVPKSKTGGADD